MRALDDFPRHAPYSWGPSGNPFNLINDAADFSAVMGFIRRHIPQANGVLRPVEDIDSRSMSASRYTWHWVDLAGMGRRESTGLDIGLMLNAPSVAVIEAGMFYGIPNPPQPNDTWIRLPAPPDPAKLGGVPVGQGALSPNSIDAMVGAPVPGRQGYRYVNGSVSPDQIVLGADGKHYKAEWQGGFGAIWFREV